MPQPLARWQRATCHLLAAAAVAFLFWANRAAGADVDFGRDVYPIFERSCQECHGPRKHEGELRLDLRAAFLKGGDSGPIVEPGKADESELVRRISLPKGDKEAMPARGDLLSAAEIASLRRWIDQGAHWPESFQPPKHWSYVAPQRPALPAVQHAEWPSGAIDRFILARLEREGLSPSAEADRATLVRRVYFDLIGLPPSVADVDRFVGDKSPDAYERLVDRLLASEQFGVRWARPWLDYARYADSHGFQKDDFRDLWAYRDWVVSALNHDMPFDQFTIEQLAGDLLPNATQSQRIATGFNRCAPTNVEAGTDPRETRTNQILDRVNTLGMVWLGTTLECTQCHDHKFDPFTTKDYYGLFAFFNSTALEADRSDPRVPGSIAFLGPRMTLSDEKQTRELADINRRLADLQKKIAARGDALALHDGQWEQSQLRAASSGAKEEVLRIEDFSSLGGATHEIQPDQSVLLSGEIPDQDIYTFTARTKSRPIDAIRLEALTDPSLPGSGPGLGDARRPNFVLREFSVSRALGRDGKPEPVRFSRARADFSQKDYDVAGAIDSHASRGWAIAPQFGKSHWAIFTLATPIAAGDETALKFTLVQKFGSSRSIGRLRISAISGNSEAMPLPNEVVEILRLPTEKRTSQQLHVLLHFRQAHDPRYQELSSDRERLARESRGHVAPTTLVMQELPQPRPTFVLQRGNFLTPGDPVEPHTPAALHPMEANHTPLNRLDLARWLVSRKNPLVARVTVNRYWAELFGHGIVTTPEDFGAKGDRPTHPELLDWLAVEFMDNGWSTKRLLREIVLSSTYRQSSRVTPELRERDDQNLLYARGPRFRLPAEAIRDNALTIAGLISLKQGGPPIRPYQPDGLWVKVGGERYEYTVSPGEQRYRRGLYVVWKRSAPYPSFVNFDANNRMSCRVRRSRSNTPLQALTLMNDPVYVEAAKALALRVLNERAAGGIDDRLTFAFRLAVARRPAESERSLLRHLWETERRAAHADFKAATAFADDVKLPSETSAEDFTAWYAVAAALLNLDETITKE